MRTKFANVTIYDRYTARAGRITTAIVALLTMAERRRQRAALAAILADDRLLKDIGMTRAEALREASLPFWR
jgi:uncharacterized protein YjiS (DUF1127 family)